MVVAVEPDKRAARSRCGSLPPQRSLREAGTGATLSDYEPLLRAGRCGDTGVKTALSRYGPLAARGAWQRDGDRGATSSDYGSLPNPVVVALEPGRTTTLSEYRSLLRKGRCNAAGTVAKVSDYEPLPRTGRCGDTGNEGSITRLRPAPRSRIVVAGPGSKADGRPTKNFVTLDLVRGPPDCRRCEQGSTANDRRTVGPATGPG